MSLAILVNEDGTQEVVLLAENPRENLEIRSIGPNFLKFLAKEWKKHPDPIGFLQKSPEKLLSGKFHAPQRKIPVM